jgi:alkanesulfonate monooxygenase SsuD/methylene tetrahydromethanopterin reductase-like flavin-dependent oxidoreductase (luciferase family)
VEEALALYRRLYQPSERHPKPQATICVWALAADTEEQARHLLKTREHWRIGFERGLRLPLVSPEEAAATAYDEADQARIAALRRRAIVGTAEQVAARLHALGAQLDLDEIVVNTWTHDPAARRHSYTLLAQAFGLTGLPSGQALG